MKKILVTITVMAASFGALYHIYSAKSVYDTTISWGAVSGLEDYIAYPGSDFPVFEIQLHFTKVTKRLNQVNFFLDDFSKEVKRKIFYKTRYEEVQRDLEKSYGKAIVKEYEDKFIYTLESEWERGDIAIQHMLFLSYREKEKFLSQHYIEFQNSSIK